MLKKIIIRFIPLVFDFLNQKVLTIAHPQLRQFAKQIVSDCQTFAELMLTNDLTDAATAQKVFEAQNPFYKTDLSVVHFPLEQPFYSPQFDKKADPFKVPHDKADVPKDFNDLPTVRKKKAVLKDSEIPRIEAQ